MALSRPSIETGVSRAPRNPFVEADRHEGIAPAVRVRQERKAWRRFTDPLTVDLRDNVLDLVAQIMDPHSEDALASTKRFVRKPGGIVALRPDHGSKADERESRGWRLARARQTRLDAKYGLVTEEEFDVRHSVGINIEDFQKRQAQRAAELARSASKEVAKVDVFIAASVENSGPTEASHDQVDIARAISMTGSTYPDDVKYASDFLVDLGPNDPKDF